MWAVFFSLPPPPPAPHPLFFGGRGVVHGELRYYWLCIRYEGVVFEFVCAGLVPFKKKKKASCILPGFVVLSTFLWRFSIVKHLMWMNGCFWYWCVSESAVVSVNFMMKNQCFSYVKNISLCSGKCSSVHSANVGRNWFFSKIGFLFFLFLVLPFRVWLEQSLSVILSNQFG